MKRDINHAVNQCEPKFWNNKRVSLALKLMSMSLIAQKCMCDKTQNNKSHYYSKTNRQTITAHLPRCPLR